MTQAVTIYTDGSARATGSIGGWACVLQFDLGGRTVEKELSGHCAEITNHQRMELTAAISGLQALKHSCAVTLVSDSEYVVKGTNYWINVWSQKNWRTSTHKPVANLDLWKKIYDLKQMHKITATWVRGHSNNVYNERCDELANQARLGIMVTP